MVKKDFIKLQKSLHENFHLWFSYSKRFDCLYSSHDISVSDRSKLQDFVGSGFICLYADGYSFIYRVV